MLALAACFDTSTALAAPPIAATRAASAVTSESATLNGVVEPGGEEVLGCYFVYGPSAGSPSSVPCAQSGFGGIAEVLVSAEVVGLQPGSTYDFHLVASNSQATGEGEERSFATSSAPIAAAVTTQSASAGDTTALLRGDVSANGSPVTACYFEYGPTAAYGSAAPCRNPVGSETTLVYAEIGGLVPATAYHYRLVATNAGGTSYGGDLAFATSPAQQPPLVIPPLTPCTPSGVPGSCYYSPPATQQRTVSVPKRVPVRRLSALQRAQAHCMTFVGSRRKRCLAALSHRYPRSMDEGLSVYHCPALIRGRASRAFVAGTSEKGWQPDECLIMDKGRAGERHTLIGPRDVHSWLLGGYGNDTIIGGNIGDVIWADYQPSGEPRHQTATIHAGNGRNVIYANDTVDYVWTGSNPRTVVHAHNPGTSGVIHCQSTGIVVFLSTVSEKHFQLIGCGRVSHYSVGY